MEKFSYNSYPDSAESSPRSREVDFDNPPPWEDQQQTQSSSYKVKFMCSYGGKIQPRPHDNQLTYVNGDTKIMSVDRSIRFQSLVSKLTTVCGGGSAGGDGGGGGEISFKYQLPGEDLDALISVTNDDDLEHMMHEYDRLLRMSTKPARMRLFLFSSSPISGGFGSEGSIKSNPIPIRPESEKSVTAAPSSNADFLFGSEKLTPQSPPAVTVPQQIQNPVSFEPPVFVNQPVIQQPDQAEIQRQIHEFQMIQIRDQEQQQMQQQQHQLQQQQQQQEAMYRRKSEDFSPTYSPAPATANQQPPIGYWQGNNNNNNIPGNVYTTMPTNLPEQQQQQQQVYMIQPQSQAPPQGALYHSVRRPPPPTQGNQGYYPSPVQTYMEQQQQNQQGYNVVQSQPQYSVGPQVMTSGGPMGLQETAPFQQMGNPVYYTVAGEGMMAQPQQSQPQYQGMGQPVSGMTDTRTAPDGKVTVNMAPKASD